MSHPIENALVQVREQIVANRADYDALLIERDELLKRGVELGVPSTLLADAAGVDKARVSQVAPKPKPVPTATDTAPERETGPEKLEQASRGIDALLGLDTLSGRYSAHQSKSYGRRPSVWVDLESLEVLGEMGPPARLDAPTLPAVLRAANLANATRVFLVGPPPAHEDEPGDAGIRAWFLDDPGPGWEVASTGHHLAEARTPTARYTTAGHTVEIMRTAAWWGESDAGVVTSRNTWFELEAKIREAFGDSARLLATPATTGRDLWQRTIGPKTTYPVLSDELRELLHATAGQGRIELCEPVTETVPAVHVRDGRLMYAALTWGMPVGPPTLLSADAIRMMPGAQLRKAIMGRSRWHVHCRVPKDWTRPFGLLMTKREIGRGWRYPYEPGEPFETWCDGSELALALAQGWRPNLLGGITWKEGKPLNTWTDKLLEIWRYFDTMPDYAMGRLATRAVRSLILFAIGAFASRGRTATFTVPEDQADRVPAGVAPHRANGMLVWTQDAPATSWAEQLAHPEWSATIWARARVRLLDGPGVDSRTGALHLNRGIHVMAFRTDALVLTGDPQWADDGKPGRLRPDGDLAGPFPWPIEEAELIRLKTAAQNMGVAQ